ncbi:hypothetical protein GCM10007989_24410 [Devosia pacifica]|uniref:Uncharacterized protein n=1 Tax=Devosia pacifica TaxID=1335967 RepID=A0A918VVT3_9HYPH|nr:hypothetical protein [Devosia pacifica]GHA27654.1 hypothetical protein GCM10007989_24410 [Devosia pacifica]
MADYQDTRNLSFCLATGCDGAVRIDRREACAWRAIAYGLAPTAEDKILDLQTMENHCANVSDLEVRAFLDAILQNVGP